VGKISKFSLGLRQKLGVDKLKRVWYGSKMATKEDLVSLDNPQQAEIATEDALQWRRYHEVLSHEWIRHEERARLFDTIQRLTLGFWIGWVGSSIVLTLLAGHGMDNLAWFRVFVTAGVFGLYMIARGLREYHLDEAERFSGPDHDPESNTWTG
jgi:hypothetical protein